MLDAMAAEGGWEETMSNRLGLEDDEISWLRTNAGRDKDADSLIAQYQMVVSCPDDPGARGIFAAMLDDWRRSRRLKCPTST